MHRLLASPRRRRRLRWAGAVAAVGLAVLLSLVFMRNTAPNHTPIYTKGKPQVYRTPHVSDHTPVERRSAIAVATEFLQTAILREHVDRSWSITEPSLHTGFTRKEWDSGNDLPFPPYHYKLVRWRPDYSYTDRIGLQVALFPDKTERQKAQVFYLDMRRHGAGKNEHWLVSEFMPAPGPGSRAPGIAEGAGGGVTGLHISTPATVGGKAPLSATWLLLPLSLFSLILLVPLFLGTRSFVRNRRAERDYARTRPLRLPHDLR
jgi:hypothetical protein